MMWAIYRLYVGNLLGLCMRLCGDNVGAKSGVGILPPIMEDQVDNKQKTKRKLGLGC